MSQLQKKIERLARQDGPRLGFGPVSREKPRAMLLAVIASSSKEVKAAHKDGADFVVVRAATASDAAKIVKDAGGDGCVGAVVGALDEAGATELHEAGSDFAIALLDKTAAAAVDSEKMGHVVEIPLSTDEPTLRGLAPLGFDALYVGDAPGALTLSGRLDFVRAATMTGTPLLVSIDGAAGAGDLRVLRDSGVAGVLVAAGTALAPLDEALKAVPPPAKGRRSGRDIAMVPTAAAAGHDHDHDDDGDDGDE